MFWLTCDSWKAFYEGNQAQPKTLHKFALLPAEVKSMLLYHAVVAKHPVVDPQAPVLPPDTCGKRLGHGKLPTSRELPQSTPPTTSATAPAPRHADHARMSLRATRAVRSIYSDTLHSSMTTPQVLRNYPAAASREQSVTLLLAVKQVTASDRWFFDQDNATRRWVSTCCGASAFTSLVGTRRLRRLRPAFANLKSINIHFLDWEQTEEVEIEEAEDHSNDCVAGGPPQDAALTLQEGISLYHQIQMLVAVPNLAIEFGMAMAGEGRRYETRTTEPVQIVDGANLKSQVAQLVEAGWKARKASIGGSERRRGDEGHVGPHWGGWDGLEREGEALQRWRLFPRSMEASSKRFHCVQTARSSQMQTCLKSWR